MGAFFRIALLLRLDAGNLNIGRWNSGSMPVLSVCSLAGEPLPAETGQHSW